MFSNGDTPQRLKQFQKRVLQLINIESRFLTPLNRCCYSMKMLVVNGFNLSNASASVSGLKCKINRGMSRN